MKGKISPAARKILKERSATNALLDFLLNGNKEVGTIRLEDGEVLTVSKNSTEYRSKNNELKNC